MRRGTPPVSLKTRRSASGVKGRTTFPAGDSQPVGHVLGRFAFAESTQVKARDHPLGELLQFGSGQHLAQFWLPDQDDLQQLAFIGFQVGEQAKLLQHVGREALCFVDDEHVVLPRRMAGQQMGVERVEVLLDRCRAWSLGVQRPHQTRGRWFSTGRRP